MAAGVIGISLEGKFLVVQESFPVPHESGARVWLNDAVKHGDHQ